MSGKITTCLWFDTEGEEAAEFYCSLFPDSRVTDVARYPEGGPGPAGAVITVSFELNGSAFVALNGGPGHPYTDAVSFQIETDDQAETDRYWDALTDGGKEIQCGWLVDRYGVSWQVVPRELPRLLADPDPGRATRAMQAMLQQKRIDIAAIREAADAG